MLEYRGTTLQDVYDARTFIEAPCAALLAQRRTGQDLARLRAALAQAERLMEDPPAFIRAHMEFHALVVELAGNETLAVLNGMVRHIRRFRGRVGLQGKTAMVTGAGRGHRRAPRRAGRRRARGHRGPRGGPGRGELGDR